MRSDRLPLVIAHRGASGYRPEHTRDAYLLAIEMGADAVEPDIVATRDGVLVIRHENEISGTTDVAAHPEFADRRTTKVIDGQRVTGWFTEDFTWAELATLRSLERLPRIRKANAAFDGQQGVLRLSDLLAVLDEAQRPVGLVAEVKHATHFDSVGLPLDELLTAELGGWARDDRLIVESFETTVLGKLRGRGVSAPVVFLVEATGSPADEVALLGNAAPTYADHLTDAGLDGLAGKVDGISVAKSILLESAELVERAHARSLRVFTWTLRAENRFLDPRFRLGGSGFGDWMSEFQLIMHSGVDGVFADQPDLAITARSSLDD
ncbi:glycerophosphodiester phosphodiesterase family protein [Cryobacterium sp. BB307]|uniref:glycerophosphodiester phosphodiesterase family protein n=1 Tax=Cryobacterium sp. BB307 TaxID=2716317 RepID=UPI0014456106